MWNRFNVELIKDGLVVNSLNITSDFFDRDITMVKEELEGAYLMMYNDNPRKDFYLPNFKEWDILNVTLANDDIEIKKQSIKRTDFDSNVLATSLREVLYGIYVFLTEE